MIFTRWCGGEQSSNKLGAKTGGDRAEVDAVSFSSGNKRRLFGGYVEATLGKFNYAGGRTIMLVPFPTARCPPAVAA